MPMKLKIHEFNKKQMKFLFEFKGNKLFSMNDLNLDDLN